MDTRKLPPIFNEDLIRQLDQTCPTWRTRYAEHSDLCGHIRIPDTRLLEDRVLRNLAPVVQACYLAMLEKVKQS